MEPHSLLWHYLWIAPHVLQAIVAAFMIRKGLAREYPIFLTYLLVDCLENIVLFAADHAASVSGSTYWYLDWIATASMTALRFALIYEILRKVLQPYPGLEELAKLVLRWSGIALFLIGVLIAARAPVNISPLLMSGVVMVGGVVSLVQAGMVVALFLFAAYFGVSFRSFVFGIAFGLGVFSTVNLAALAVDMSFPANTYVPTIDVVLMATYHLCVLVWLFYLLAPASASEVVQIVPESNLQRWNAELERLLMR